MTKKPNLRAIKTAKLILESNGAKAVSKAMLEAGYAAPTAKNPQQLTRSAMWLGLMDEKLPDSFLMRKHRALLNKKENIVAFENGKKTYVKTQDIDPYAVGKGLELAYKIKGKFTDSNVTNIGEVKVLINDP